MSNRNIEQEVQCSFNDNRQLAIISQSVYLLCKLSGACKTALKYRCPVPIKSYDVIKWILRSLTICIVFGNGCDIFT